MTPGKCWRPGEIGEICVRGGNVMLGYWNQPGGNGQGVPQRLAVDRRHRLSRRRRLLLHHRPQKGHAAGQRQQCLSAGNRGGHLPVSRREGSGGDRCAGPAQGRAAGGVCGGGGGANIWKKRRCCNSCAANWPTTKCRNRWFSCRLCLEMPRGKSSKPRSGNSRWHKNDLCGRQAVHL